MAACCAKAPIASASPEQPKDRSVSRTDAFDIRPLMFASMACTMALMAFVAVVAPVARQLGLQPWQAGATVTVSGLVWMLLARRWGGASDRRGRRPMLLRGAAGVTVAYLAMCLAIDASLRLNPPVWLAFVAMMLSRSAVGAFYASIPAVGQALIADHVPPATRAGAMAAFGAASGVGLVLGPAAAAWLSQFSLAAPLYGMAVLPLLALAVLWRTLPHEAPRAAESAAPIRLGDARLRRPMAVAFVAMFGVGVAQITVGFFALDRFGLDAAAAARVAGIALTMVGVALVLSQLLVRRLKLAPQQMIRIGGLVAACGFGSAVWVESVPGLWAAYFVAAAGMGWIFPAFSALAANAVQPHEQGSTAGTIGAAQGLGMVAGPLTGTLVYAAGPAVPYLLVAALLLVMALWPAAKPAADQGVSV
jgi:MFS transporter, DHA1 family, tetracycline resistance protein